MAEAFICDYVRKSYGGALSVRSHRRSRFYSYQSLGWPRNPSVDWHALDEVTATPTGGRGQSQRTRMALLLAGLPKSVPGTTMNRLCGSGMDAVLSAARAIKAGEIDRSRAAWSPCRARPLWCQGQNSPSLAFQLNLRYHHWLALRQRADAAALRHKLDPETAAEENPHLATGPLRIGLAEKGGPGAAKWTASEGDKREHRAANRGDPLVVEKDEHPRPGVTLEGGESCPRHFASPER